MSAAYELLETLQEDTIAVLKSTPTLAHANIIAEQNGDLESEVERLLGFTKSGSGGKRGLVLVVMQPEVTSAEANLPGPPMIVKQEIQVIEHPRINRTAAGTNLRSSHAALLALNALHLHGMGGHATYAEEKPIEPLPMKDGLVSHVVSVFARANGLQGPGKAGAVEVDLEGGGGYIVSGIVDTNINGPLFQGSPAIQSSSVLNGLFPLPGTAYYTSDGQSVRAVTGYWVALWRSSFFTRSSATIESIFPPANYTAGSKTVSPIGTLIRISGVDYILLSGPNRWALFADETNADAGGVVIPADTEIIFYSGVGIGGELTDLSITGGLAATWLADPATEFMWRLRQFFNNTASGQGNWTGKGTSPETAAWSTSAMKPGVLAVTGATLTLTCPTPGASIRYTTNGTYPTPAAGTLYTAPFPPPAVGTTVRAAAYKTGLNPGDCLEFNITA